MQPQGTPRSRESASRRIGFLFRLRAITPVQFATWGLLIVFAAFSTWLVWTFFETLKFGDRLLEREYEGNLSTHLGFLVVLTSEASRKESLRSPAEKEATLELVERLRSIKRTLENLRPLTPGLSDRRQPRFLEEMTDPTELRRLLDDPNLGEWSLAELGLRLGKVPDLPDYPYLETLIPLNGASSFVFIPASGVDSSGSTARLSLKIRRELVFSKLAEQELRRLLAQGFHRRIPQAYYISCSDFARFVFLHPQKDLGRYKGFWPLRSFVDRTYFSGTSNSPDRLRVSNRYLDVTGAGFVQTYSAFINNRNLGLCGMLALDVDQQPIATFWREVTLGKTGSLRDFTFGTYSMVDREIEPDGSIPKRLHREIANGLAAKGKDLLGGIQRLKVRDTKIFTVPIGGNKIGLFVLDARTRRIKYLLIVLAGLIAIVGFVIMVSMATRERLAAAEAEKRLFEILENLHGGFVIVDGAGKILKANSRFWEMVSSQSESESIHRYLSPESSAELRELSRSRELSRRGGFEFAGKLISAEKRKLPVIIASAPLRSAGWEHSRMLILIPSQELEQTIAKKFLNIFSHALKSPAHSILLIGDLFRRRNAMPRFDEYFAMLHRKIDEFRDLTDNVLRFSAMEVKDIQVQRDWVNVAQVLRRVLRLARERASAKGLAMRESIPESLRTRADRKLLQVVFNNLVDNALKYTSAGYLAVFAEDLLTEIRITVEDSGPGVPATERDRIFDLFVQGSGAEQASHEGLGLGLYISRRYIEAMGGTLRYEPVFEGVVASGPDESLAGSRFIIKLPKPSGGQDRGEEEGDIAARG